MVRPDLDLMGRRLRKGQEAEHFSCAHRDAQYSVHHEVIHPETRRGKLQIDWLGIVFYPDTQLGLALLGTPHLEGVAWMLHNHRDVISKTIAKIRVFTKGGEYYMLIYLK
ncbi:MAG: hypothetical protein Q9218_007901 [Villophora microphyllina]